MKRYIRSARNYGINAIPDSAHVIDSGYASNKQDFIRIKEQWLEKDPDAIVTRTRTDTPGLISYMVWKNEV